MPVTPEADSPAAENYSLSTEEYAGRLRLLPQSIRARYCRFGSYYGTKPLKLPNGRLLWPNTPVTAAPETAEAT
jgi:hypothetical protein